jgi:hypothetical protein
MIETCQRCTRQRKILKRSFEIVAVVLILVMLYYLVIPSVAKVRYPSERMKISNDLKQIGIAMHSYHDATGHLPGANAPYPDPKGSGQKYPASWRILIIPFVEATDYQTGYRFDEPWDGPNNIGLLARMPRFLRHPKADSEQTPPGYTHYRIIVSRPDAKPSALFTDGLPGPKLKEIPDGTSGTIMIVEAEEAVPWTMPEVLLYDRNQPLPRLGGHLGKFFLAVLADGSVKSFRSDMPEHKLRAWITKDGGEPVGDE